MTSIKSESSNISRENAKDHNVVEKTSNLQNFLPGISVISVKENSETNVKEPLSLPVTENSESDSKEPCSMPLPKEVETKPLGNSILEGVDEGKTEVKGEAPILESQTIMSNVSMEDTEINISLDESLADSSMSKEESTAVLKCPITGCKLNQSFGTRSEILIHLSWSHYAKEILNIHPFAKGAACSLCDNGKVVSVKKNHVLHIGVKHELVFELLPEELKSILQALPKGKGKGKKPKDEVPLKSDEHQSTDVEIPGGEVPSIVPVLEEETQFQ